jgi:hypothetical protein
MRSFAAAAAALAVVSLVHAQNAQPSMFHIALTGRAGELSIDFVSHQPNCSGFGVQYGESTTGMKFVSSATFRRPLPPWAERLPFRMWPDNQLPLSQYCAHHLIARSLLYCID